MSWLSLALDGVMSALLLVMIAYCMKLNRLLVGLRERDAEIESLMVRFREASDRAEMSVAALRSAGTEVEQEIRAATERARRLRDELMGLVARGASGHHPGSAPSERSPATMQTAEPARGAAPENSIFPPELFGPEEASPGREPAPSRDMERSEAEQALLQAIRSARAGG